MEFNVLRFFAGLIWMYNGFTLLVDKNKLSVSGFVWRFIMLATAILLEVLF